MSLILRNAQVVLSTSTGEGMHDISDSVTKVAIKRKIGFIDITKINATAHQRLFDSEEWNMSIGVLQSFSTDQARGESGKRLDKLFDILEKISASGKSFHVKVLADRGQPKGENNPEYAGTCLLKAYRPVDGKVGSLLKVNLDLIGTGSLERGSAGVTQVSVSDSLSIRTSEAISILEGTIPVSVSDSLKVQASESALSIAYGVRAADTLSVHISSETASIHYADIAFVQSASKLDSGTSISKAFTSNITAGNIIIVTMVADLEPTSISDNQGNTYQVAHAFNVYGAAMYYAENVAAGATTVTINFSGSTSYNNIEIHEYSNVAIANALDQTILNVQLGVSPGTDVMTSTPLTPSLAKSLIFAMCNGTDENFPTVDMAPGTGFTQREHPFNTIQTIDKILATKTAIAALGTVTGASIADAMVLMAIFKPQAKP